MALAQNRNAKIGEFGRAKLCSSAFSENDSEVLELFIRNYQPQDDALILAALRRLSPNDDNAHGIGLNILAICDENDSLVFSELMRWVYETTPCTVCRHSAVKWMVSSENATPEIIFECLHDANEEIRQLGEQRH